MRMTLFLLLSLAACGQEGVSATGANTAESNPRATDSSSPAATPTESIAGTWRVGRINDTPLTQPHLITLEIDEHTITASSQCIRFQWRYRAEAERFSVISAPIDNAVTSCSRGLTEDEERFSSLLPRVTHAAHGPDGRAALYSEGISITLVHTGL